MFSTSKALATPRKKACNPRRGRDPQVENHCLSATHSQQNSKELYYFILNIKKFKLKIINKVLSCKHSIWMSENKVLLLSFELKRAFFT